MPDERQPPPPAGADSASDPSQPSPVRVGTPGGDGTAATVVDGSSRAGRPTRLTPMPSAPSFGPRSFAERYEHRRLLGRGGMGEVRLYRDRSIGRDVAIKAVRADQKLTYSDAEARFLREVRVQGQLEHPSVVPVYDAGRDASGRMYLSMKRVRGVTLAEVLLELRCDDEPEAKPRFSRRQLLGLFSRVCMAVHYAHRKGVVHRDLKPANVMFGDFGEVYLLDWGIAALREELAFEEDVVEEVTTGPDLQTHRLGTPGYMAPEQILSPRKVDARADVYALGAILFEILTLQKLHSDVSAELAVESTLSLTEASPAARAPDDEVPPELDQLCREATRRAAGQRLASAEELSRRLEAFLDGDRDLVLRRNLAQEHFVQAEAAVERATQGDAAQELAARADAMREVGAALGLDPQHQGALRLFAGLLTEPPRAVPHGVRRQIEWRQEAAHNFAVRSSLGFYAGTLCYLPLLLWMGVRDWGLFLAGWLAIALCAVVAVRSLSRTRSGALPWEHLLVSTLTVAFSAILFGPFVFVPTIALGQSVSYITSVGSGRGWVPLAGVAAVLLPWALQAAGVWPASYLFADGVWQILPGVTELPQGATTVFMLAAAVGTIVPACYMTSRLRDAATRAEQRLQLQAWQLRQMVPSLE